MNQIKLIGTITEDITFSHECKGEHFYKTFVSCKRHNDMQDVLPIIMPHSIKRINSIVKGSHVELCGECRTYNTESHSVKVFIFVTQIRHTEAADFNIIQLAGYICKPPISRRTPSGKIIADIILAVNRKHGKSDYIPCIVWNNDANIVLGYRSCELVSFIGRMQSRIYSKGIAYEISVHAVYGL